MANATSGDGLKILAIATIDELKDPSLLHLIQRLHERDSTVSLRLTRRTPGGYLDPMNDCSFLARVSRLPAFQGQHLEEFRVVDAREGYEWRSHRASRRSLPFVGPTFMPFDDKCSYFWGARAAPWEACAGSYQIIIHSRGSALVFAEIYPSANGFWAHDPMHNPRECILCHKEMKAGPCCFHPGE